MISRNWRSLKSINKLPRQSNHHRPWDDDLDTHTHHRRSSSSWWKDFFLFNGWDNQWRLSHKSLIKSKDKRTKPLGTIARRLRNIKEPSNQPKKSASQEFAFLFHSATSSSSTFRRSSNRQPWQCVIETKKRANNGGENNWRIQPWIWT